MMNVWGNYEFSMKNNGWISLMSNFRVHISLHLTLLFPHVYINPNNLYFPKSLNEVIYDKRTSKINSTRVLFVIWPLMTHINDVLNECTQRLHKVICIQLWNPLQYLSIRGDFPFKITFYIISIAKLHSGCSQIYNSIFI